MLTKTVVVINDFRAVPIAAAIDIARRERNVRFMVSAESLRFRDFGDSVLRPQKFLVLFLLKAFGSVEVVSSKKLEEPIKNYHGFRSSLISITNSYLVSEGDFPNISAGLRKLERGAVNVFQRIAAYQPNVVYVFNGRTVSSQPIATELSTAASIKVFGYEWGGQHRMTYAVETHPLHDSRRISESIVEWARSRNFKYDARRAKAFIEQKLANTYNLEAGRKSSRNFASVIFAGSPHEHAVMEMSNLSTLDGDTLALVREAVVSGRLVAPCALRMHPNMIKDPTLEEQIANLRSFLGPLGIDLITPYNRISAASLITHAENVIVGNSSVGLDSIFLGKWPVIVGHPPYKGIIEEVAEKIPEGPRRAECVAGILADYHDPNVRNFGSVASAIWLVLRVLEKLHDLARIPLVRKPRSQTP